MAQQDSNTNPSGQKKDAAATNNTGAALRGIAAQTLAQVLHQQASLASLMAPAQEKVAPQDQALLQELCFGTLRWQPQLQSILGRLLEKPLKDKDQDVQALLLLGLYQLLYTRIPDHASLSATVDAAKKLKKPWAQKLVNAVLRNFLRSRELLEEALVKSPAYLTAHPNWLRKRIEAFWPEQAKDIFAANNEHPPFTLRVDLQQQSREEFLEQLNTAELEARPAPFSRFGVTLNQAAGVESIPGFSEGKASVQDEAAQLAADLLQLQPGQRVLDACAAPGGKTGHILEAEPQLAEVTALDLEERRLVRVQENLTRLKKTAKLVCADASDLKAWWDGQTFDRILLDAPCSATGVIRRHPDIKLLRKPGDIAKLATLQLSLLQALWQTLAPGGRLVYATCSVLPTENSQVIEAFLADQEDAQHSQIEADWGIAQTFGRQLLPQIKGHDGFYYACLNKRA